MSIKVSKTSWISPSINPTLFIEFNKPTGLYSQHHEVQLHCVNRKHFMLYISHNVDTNKPGSIFALCDDCRSDYGVVNVLYEYHYSDVMEKYSSVGAHGQLRMSRFTYDADNAPIQVGFATYLDSEGASMTAAIAPTAPMVVSSVAPNRRMFLPVLRKQDETDLLFAIELW